MFAMDVRFGDIYGLGEHRVMCGDSTDSRMVDALLDGEFASILMTSPPYYDVRTYGGGINLDVDHVDKFIEVWRPYTDYQIVNLGLVRRCGELITYWDSYIRLAKRVGYKLLAWLVWDQISVGGINRKRAMFPIRHEWVFVFGTEVKKLHSTWQKKGSYEGKKQDKTYRHRDGSLTTEPCYWHNDTTLKPMESVLQIGRKYSKLIRREQRHPAMFPVQLPTEFILSMTNPGELVLDPFLGSGTTLIAAHQNQRVCYGMELNPDYVALTLQQYEAMTGEKPRLIHRNPFSYIAVRQECKACPNQPHCLNQYANAH